MAAIDFDIDVDIALVSEQLAQVVNALGSVGRFLDTEALAWFKMRAEERFFDEGDDASGPWAPLKWITEEVRALEGFPRAHPINVRTTDLRTWLLASDGVNVDNGAYASLTWPGPAPDEETTRKFNTAQKGKKSPNPTVPRPVAVMNRVDEKVVTFDFARWLTANTGLDLA